MLSELKKLYNKSLFQPTFFGLFFNPFFIIRGGLYRGVAQSSAYMHGRLLDFGCGSKPYKSLFDVTEYIGTDIAVSGHDHRHEEIDVYYDGKTLPFTDAYFDSIFSSEVFEHIFNLPEMLGELHRVLKPGGQMLVTLPFVWDEHEIPYDYARYTSFGIRHLLEQSGFIVLESRKTTNYVATICQMWIAYVYQHIFPKRKIFRIALTPFFITPLTLCALLLSALLPKNMNFFHNNILVVQKPANLSESR
ncbi:class I SAM-dependent methyltransferase [Parapedobacter koreensis]|uniref:Methyltransferase domain-containing protein n=1 Tax=Parapedobacter koreensis TaxID=332977 RepID=A0A1H7QES5_9SPHI|nr:class I SAM-dependent methyltransferase [Parapedobacter koreensis]SEL46319.1 Methyltransferase domain-containing protein [Parapedobacter koreensis]